MDSISSSTSQEVSFSKNEYRAETILALGYFMIYLGYLFFHPESEMEHWVSMVIIPVALLVLYQKYSSGSFSIQRTFSSIGLRWGSLSTWIGWAILLGFGLSGLQLFIGSKAQEAIELFKSGNGFWMFPLVVALLLVTVGITEEVLFRGILQTRISKWLDSKVWSIVAVSILFSMYHIPYAYLNPNWPSAGNLLAATGAAFANGMLGGAVLGIVYERSRHNLVACIIVHALINSLPAMTMLRIQVGGQ